MMISLKASSPVEVHGLDEVAGLDRDPAGLPLEALVVRHAGVDADEDTVALPLSFPPAAPGGVRGGGRGLIPMPLGDRGESRGGGGEKLFLRRESCGQDVGQVGRWQKKERAELYSDLFIKEREERSILVSCP